MKHNTHAFNRPKLQFLQSKDLSLFWQFHHSKPTMVPATKRTTRNDKAATKTQAASKTKAKAKKVEAKKKKHAEAKKKKQAATATKRAETTKKAATKMPQSEQTCTQNTNHACIMAGKQNNPVRPAQPKVTWDAIVESVAVPHEKTSHDITMSSQLLMTLRQSPINTLTVVGDYPWETTMVSRATMPSSSVVLPCGGHAECHSTGQSTTAASGQSHRWTRVATTSRIKNNESDPS